MPANTPRLALPYPVGADLVNVQGDIQALATRLDNLLPQRVTVLPTTGLVDGMTVDYVADAANGIIWRLRYNQGSASAYKWEFVGGSELSALAHNSSTNPSVNVFVDFNDCQITPPLAGDYAVRFGGTGVSPGSGAISMRLAQGAIVSDVAFEQGLGASGYGQIHMPSKMAAVAAGVAIKWQGNSSSGTLTSYDRHFVMRPIRVG